MMVQTGLVEFRRIDAVDPDPTAGNLKRVAVDDPGRTSDVLSQPLRSEQQKGGNKG